MRDLLEQKLARYEQLEKDLMDPEVLSVPARITSVAREHGSLGKLAKMRDTMETQQQTQTVQTGTFGKTVPGRGTKRAQSESLAQVSAR